MKIEGETAVVGEGRVLAGERERERLRERTSRVGRRKRVVRRRLVCGAFTGVGPSFILPLQSVNTYLPVRAGARARYTRTRGVHA